MVYLAACIIVVVAALWIVNAVWVTVKGQKILRALEEARSYLTTGGSMHKSRYYEALLLLYELGILNQAQAGALIDAPQEEEMYSLPRNLQIHLAKQKHGELFADAAIGARKMLAARVKRLLADLDADPRDETIRQLADKALLAAAQPPTP